VLAFVDALEPDVRLADEPKRFVTGTLLFEVFGEEVGVHLHLEQSQAGPVGFVDVFGGLGIELECGEEKQFRTRYEGLSVFDRAGHLALFQWCVFRTEGDGDALGTGRSAGFVRWSCLAVGVQPTAAREWLQPGKADVLTLLPPNPGAEQLVAPFPLT
jgi:hypothetical protein